MGWNEPGADATSVRMRRVCVFCGSSPGRGPAWADATRALADALVRRGLGCVFGGGRVGLMGVVADAVLAAGGEVIGELRLVASMHERKAVMADLSDGFVALPGGLGTLEELFEVLTWSQLGIHRKPVGVLDVGGYWTGLRRWLDDAVGAGFVSADNARLVLFADDADTLLDRMAAWAPPPGPRIWLDRDET
jgi:predicted Rossmann-fold nucleotide-binding protein